MGLNIIYFYFQANLKKLRIFHAVDCKLTSDKLPQSFFTLPSLIELNLSKNQLSSIEGVEILKTLMRLDLSENQLLEIPSNIEQLENLESLSLAIGIQRMQLFHHFVIIIVTQFTLAVSGCRRSVH